MSLFSTKHAPMQEPELSPDMRQRLDALHERQDRFERIVKELRLEWDEMYDKFRLLFARLSKRIKDATALVEPDENGQQSRQDAPGSTNGRLTGYGQPPLHKRGLPGRRNY